MVQPIKALAKLTIGTTYRDPRQYSADPKQIKDWNGRVGKAEKVNDDWLYTEKPWTAKQHGKATADFIRRLDFLSPEDVAAALSGLDRGPYLLARFIFCLDGSVSRELVKLAAATQSMNRFAVEIRERVACVAILESSQTIICKSCNGERVMPTAAGLIDCADCHGTGFRRWSQRDRAEAFGSCQTSWREQYNVYYEKNVVSTFFRWRAIALANVWFHLERENEFSTDY